MTDQEEFKDFLERVLGTDYYDDFTEGGYHAAIKYAKACVESKDKVIEQQAAELESLRELLSTALILDKEETELVLEWFNSVQDTNTHFLDKNDYVLAIKVLEALKLRVPYSVKFGAGL